MRDGDFKRLLDVVASELNRVSEESRKEIFKLKLEINTHRNIQSVLKSERDSFREQVEELKKAQCWIPVEDCLPEVGKQALVAGELGLSIRTRLSEEADMWKATHWMPLPEPPKREVQP